MTERLSDDQLMGHALAVDTWPDHQRLLAHIGEVRQHDIVSELLYLVANNSVSTARRYAVLALPCIDCGARPWFPCVTDGRVHTHDHFHDTRARGFDSA